MPTAAEDAAIVAGIAADSDAMEITSADVARMQARGRGRSKLAAPKVPVTMRLAANVLEKVKSTGDGWQTRVSNLLRAAVTTGKLGAWIQRACQFSSDEKVWLYHGFVRLSIDKNRANC